MIPAEVLVRNVLARNVPPLRCYYCALEGQIDPSGKPRPPIGGVSRTHGMGFVTVHDRRGCFHVCFEHATWRMTTSFMFGHSIDCPYFRSEDSLDDFVLP